MKEKGDTYYLRAREDLIRLVPLSAKRILEIGCAAGMTGKALRERLLEELVGVELLEELAEKARPYYTKIFTGDIEQLDLPFKEGHFDCIIYGDVLEHLVDPWALLKRHRLLLKDGGTIVLSIPNIRHYRIVKKLLLHDTWEYTGDGVLDKTHLRFFTLKSIRSMLAEAGFEIATIIKRPHGSKLLKGVNWLTGNCLSGHLVRQYKILALKKR
jgi:2-polyprenyl-3-methyl-5-hydroxy-6-metoxy-1,4-benzoquinol methylase